MGPNHTAVQTCGTACMAVMLLSPYTRLHSADLLLSTADSQHVGPVETERYNCAFCYSAGMQFLCTIFQSFLIVALSNDTLQQYSSFSCVLYYDIIIWSYIEALRKGHLSVRVYMRWPWVELDGRFWTISISGTPTFVPEIEMVQNRPSNPTFVL